MKTDEVARLLNIDPILVSAADSRVSVDTLILEQLNTGKVTTERARKLCSLAYSVEVKKRCLQVVDTPIIAELNQGVTSKRAEELYGLACLEDTRQAIIRQLLVRC